MSRLRSDKAGLCSAAMALGVTLALAGACAPPASSGPAETASAGRAPILLTASEMSRVSAAGVSVDMDAAALVSGQFGEADTHVMTGIVALGPQTIGYGFGSGEAIACCGDDSEVLLDMTASGVGDYVFADTHVAYGGDGATKFGIMQGLVLALSGPSRDELARATRDYVGQLALAPPSTYRPGGANPLTPTAAR